MRETALVFTPSPHKPMWRSSVNDASAKQVADAAPAAALQQLEAAWPRAFVPDPAAGLGQGPTGGAALPAPETHGAPSPPAGPGPDALGPAPGSTAQLASAQAPASAATPAEAAPAAGRGPRPVQLARRKRGSAAAPMREGFS